jgi:NADH:ubiquinone oxidoreductase subunit C
MNFLREKNLLDKSEKEELDRCYSLLEIDENENISVKTYIEKNPEEI